MRLSPTPPDVADNGWYNTTTTMKKLGVAKTTFYRLVYAGKIKRRLRSIDNNFWYQGKEIKKVWNAFS